MINIIKGNILEVKVGKLTKKVVLFVSISCCMFGLQASADENTESLGEVIMSPSIRSEPLSTAAYKIYTNDISAHLKNLLLFNSKKEYDSMAEIISYEPNEISASFGQNIFVEKNLSDEHSTFSVLRREQVYEDPKTCTVIGQGAIIVGEARVVNREKDVVQLEVVKSTTKLLKGDKLIPRVAINLPATIEASYPLQEVKGQVIGIQNGLWGSASYDSVVMDVGEDKKIRVGHVLNIMLKNDGNGLKKRKPKSKECELDVPLQKYGEVMIFKVFDKLSLGIIIKSQRLVSVADVVQTDGASSGGIY